LYTLFQDIIRQFKKYFSDKNQLGIHPDYHDTLPECPTAPTPIGFTCSFTLDPNISTII